MTYLSFFSVDGDVGQAFFMKTPRSSKRFDGPLYMFYINNPKDLIINSRTKKLIKQYSFIEDCI